MAHKWFMGMLALLLALILVMAAVPTGAQPASVNPAAGGPGTRFEFFASGFAGDERVEYWLDMPDGRVKGNAEDYWLVTDDAGRAEWSWRSPPGAVTGTWVMVARGRESGVTQSISFDIGAPSARPDTPAEPAPAPSNVEPNQGGPGTTFFFFASGFDDDEWVGYWLNAPDGSLVSSNDFGVHAYRGRADWSWEAPTAPLRGTWQMVAQGQDSGTIHVITFDIR